MYKRINRLNRILILLNLSCWKGVLIDATRHRSLTLLDSSGWAHLSDILKVLPPGELGPAFDQAAWALGHRLLRAFLRAELATAQKPPTERLKELQKRSKKDQKRVKKEWKTRLFFIFFLRSGPPARIPRCSWSLWVYGAASRRWPGPFEALWKSQKTWNPIGKTHKRTYVTYMIYEIHWNSLKFLEILCIFLFDTQDAKLSTSRCYTEIPCDEELGELFRDREPRHCKFSFFFTFRSI